MRTSVIAAAAFVCATAGINAQAPVQTPAPVPPLASGGNQTVQITGCIARSPHSDATAGSGSATAAAGGFALTNARMSNDSPTGTAQPSREDPRNTAAAAGRGAPAPASAATSYTLNAGTTNLTPHVGHQVEITGRLEPSATTSGSVGTAGRGTAGTPTPDAGAAASAGANAAPTQTLRVESLRMIAASCEAAR